MGIFPAARNKKALRSSIHLVAMSILSFGVGFLMSYDAATLRDNSLSLGHHGMEEKNISHDAATSGGAQNAPPSTTLELLGTILIKQRQIYNSVKSEYGRFSNIFNTEIIERIFQLSPLSKKRFIRKLMMKILMGRLHNNRIGGGQAEDGEPTFHWVTAGDSAAAGHGNSFVHSYTSIMKDTVGDLFKSAGIAFVTTNHAGDAWSGMELALCMKSIFGKDVDVLSWDFMQMNSAAASDGDPLSPSQGLDPLLFGERAGLVLPHLPFLFFLGLSSEGGAWESLQKLETSGIGIDIMGGELLRELILTFPDYNDEQRRNVAQAINKFHCGGVIEGKDPNGGRDCDRQIKNIVLNAKYNAGGLCANERYQTPSNDGWKMHRLKGRLLGFHLIQMLHDAAIELDTFERQHPQLHINDALNALREEEETEEFLFSKTRPSRLENQGSTMVESWNILKQKDAICLNAKAALRTPQTKHLPKFEFDPPREALCEEFIPFQNVYFRVTEEDGWVSIDPLTLLHEVIREKGHVAMGLCFKHCYGNQCGERATDELGINWNKVVIRVNGNRVSGLKQVGGCYILEGEEGVLWNEQTLGSGMKIQNQDDGALLLSSAFILY